MNLNPSRPKEMNEIMFGVFGTGKKKKKLLPHEEAAKNISKMLKEKGL